MLSPVRNQNSTQRLEADKAIGVMQIMPRTAAFIANDRSFRSRDGHKALMDPSLNLKLGQEYVGHLLKQESVNEGLFQLLAAYNAGPGTLRKWTRKLDFKEDPAVHRIHPAAETREFIERVLTNLWMYRLRLASRHHHWTILPPGRGRVISR